MVKPKPVKTYPNKLALQPTLTHSTSYSDNDVQHTQFIIHIHIWSLEQNSYFDANQSHRDPSCDCFNSKYLR